MNQPRHTQLLRTIGVRASRAVTARKHLEDAIRDAHTEGLPLRTIAEAAQMSHESVRRLVSQ